MFGIALDLPSTIALRVLLILIGAAAALIAARVALVAAARGVLGRRSSSASNLMATGELELRVHTLQRLAIRVIGSVIVIVVPP